MRVKRDARAEEVVNRLVHLLNVQHVRADSIRVVRSNSDSRAYARIWGVNKVLQVALGTGPVYVIELIDPKFSRLDCYQKVLTIVHELAHIPRTFSGYIRPHNVYFKRDLRKFKSSLRKLSQHELKELCSMLE